MKHQLMSGCLWLCTVILSLTAALATPVVPAVEGHGRAHAGTQAGSSPFGPERAPSRSGRIDFWQ